MLGSWCGVGIDYCAGPDCQLAYGPGCDGNQSPSGASTASVARPVLGSMPYGGAGIYDCLTAGGTILIQVALLNYSYFVRYCLHFR